LKFKIFAGTIEKTSVADVQGQTASVYKLPSCTVGAEDAITELTNTGSTSLRYDSTGGQFIQNWQTPKGANTCYRVEVTAADGTKIDKAYFKTK